MFNLKIITSTQHRRRTDSIITDWITKAAKKRRDFKADTFYLGEINLPMMNERHHPILKKYEKAPPKHRSLEIEQTDAFIFVTAKYSHSYPTSLRNALQYLSEWTYTGIISYGSILAGTGSFNDLEDNLSTLSAVSMVQAVHIPFFPQFTNEEDAFIPNDKLQRLADTMLDKLERLSKGGQAVKDYNLNHAAN